MKFTQSAILCLFLGATNATKLVAEGPKKEEEAKPVGPPEKVHNLKPTHAQDLSNNLDAEYPTFPQPIGLGAGRTAFYAQQEPQAHSQQTHHHHHHHKSNDIGDQGIDEGVHGFASNDKSVLPQPWRRVNEAYPANGSRNGSWQWIDSAAASTTAPAAALSQHHHHHHHKSKDIGDEGIDEAVHGFASSDKSVLPQPWRRVKEAYPVNGSKNPTWQWVGEEGLAQKQDIGNSKWVRPDVWHFVNENIGSVPQYRRKTAPKHKFEAGKSGQGIDIVSSGPSGASSAF